MKTMQATTLTALALPGLIAANTVMADEEDGAPHIAIVDDGTTLTIDFEVEAGFEDGNPPTLTLLAPVYSPTFVGYITEPINDTPAPNDDLGFVSEYVGLDSNGSFSGDIIVRMLSKDANFAAFESGSLIFTDSATDLALGTNFDTHPRWILANSEGDFTPASASFEVFDVSSGSEISIGTFDVLLTVPEPGSAIALLVGAGLIAGRRRRNK